MNPLDRTALFRILDANANRAGEALRVVEEYARFVLQDAHLAGLLKQLRHDLETTLQSVPAYQRCTARDTPRDVGTRLQTTAEYHRESPRAVAAANQKRVEQSLRALEEYLKPLDPTAAAGIEQLRYRSYTIERALEITAAGRRRLDSTRLYVLLEGGSSAEELTRLASTLIDAGVGAFQLRDKRLGDQALLERAICLRQLTQQKGVLLIVNDRPDLALLSGADGVHLGQEDLPAGEVRRLVGADLLIGVSTHSIEQARRAVLDGADYLGCGPTFPSPTKSFTAFPGLAYLREVAAEIGLPAFAIGGITHENLPDVVASGFCRIAVSSEVVAAADPAAAAHRLAGRLTRAAARAATPQVTN